MEHEKLINGSEEGEAVVKKSIIPYKFNDGDNVHAMVYCLKSNEQVIYIGCTTLSLKRRLCIHYNVAFSKKDKSPLYCFLNKNKDVTIHLIEEVNYKYDKRFGHTQAFRLENYWIREYKRMGFLMNAILPTENEIRKKVYSNKLTSATPFSLNLRCVRKFVGLTQEAASQKIGIKRSLLAAYEESRAEPPMHTLASICRIYKITDLILFINYEIDFFENTIVVNAA